MLQESARLARGEISPITELVSDDFDAVIVPGGFGAAKNLSNFAEAGAECWVDEDLARLTREMHKANKPIGLMCIAPALLPKLLDQQARLTIGNDPDLGEVIDAMGGEPVICPVDDIVVDSEHKIVTTPAYMLAPSIAQAALGIDKLVARVLELSE